MTTVASVAFSESNFPRASLVLAWAGLPPPSWLPPTLATCSSHRPSEMNTISMGGVSKNVMGLVVSCMAIEAITTAQLGGEGVAVG